MQKKKKETKKKNSIRQKIYTKYRFRHFCLKIKKKKRKKNIKNFKKKTEFKN